MVREGTDVSIFTYSRMRYVVMQAVAELEKKGYNPEVSGCSVATQHQWSLQSSSMVMQCLKCACLWPSGWSLTQPDDRAASPAEPLHLLSKPGALPQNPLPSMLPSSCCCHR